MAVLTNERTPLLTDFHRQPESERVPWAQFGVLFLIRVIPRICFAQILPYVVPFLLYLGVSPLDIGYSAGILESCYPLFVVLMLEPSRWCSDRFGRRPTLLVALTLSGIACASCGFSSNLQQAVVTRALLGVTGAFVIPTVLCMCAEIATKKTQAIAFAVFGSGFTLGSAIAPVIGGVFAEPARRWPALEDTLWQRYPFAMPGCVVALLASVAVVAGMLILPETLVRRSQGKTQQLEPIFAPRVTYMAIAYTWTITIVVAISAAEVLLYASKPEHFGLGLSTQDIAIIFGVRSLLSLLTGPWLYPLLATFGPPESIFRHGIWLLSIICLILYGLAQAGLHGYLDRKTIVPVILAMNLIQSISGPSITACIQSLSSRAPSRTHLARMSSISEYCSNVAHFLGASFGSSLFALFGQSRLRGGSNNVWLVLAFCSGCLGVYAQYATNEPGWREADELDSSAERATEA